MAWGAWAWTWRTEMRKKAKGNRDEENLINFFRSDKALTDRRRQTPQNLRRPSAICRPLPVRGVLARLLGRGALTPADPAPAAEAPPAAKRTSAAGLVQSKSSCAPYSPEIMDENC